MKEITADKKLVAACGLYCGACKRYLRGKCPGCRENDRASWCKLRSCCRNKGYSSCAECTDFPVPVDCKLFNNPMSKLFGLIFRSDRAACIEQIRALGLEGHAEHMAVMKRQSLKRK